ncbi:MAG: hypothetical protein JW995_13610 [Melioribacteraceae bacterium]|nr:hypothetical protein [Melioribacteraceae bacterium]
MSDIEPLKITYSFNFENQIVKQFDLLIDADKFSIVHDESVKPPQWAELKSFRCPNCPLDSEKVKYCPLAINLAQVIEFFNNFPSYHEVLVSVETSERTTLKQTTVQIGVGSLIGIIMSCSGCPVIGRLKSLVRFHLPFSSLEETEFRIISMYLVAQYFKMKEGLNPDWELKKLLDAYKEIQIMNKNLVEKLSHIEMNDTSRNAVVTLSNFAEYIIMELEDKNLDNLRNFADSFYGIE